MLLLLGSVTVKLASSIVVAAVVLVAHEAAVDTAQAQLSSPSD
jgi:hypothetical protein